jgi:Protein of unknown function (DUF3429)
MPMIAVPLALLSLVPFVWFGLGAVSADLNTAARSLIALIDYAALILTFGGGVHWGLGFSPDVRRPTIRLLAGIAPLVVAWAALVSVPLAGGLVALVILMVGYLLAILIEHRAATLWLVPGRYMMLRWAISVVALVMLLVVLVLRGLGQTIVF